MADALPDPLVAADVDLRGFHGFMLNVDRLMASELVALGTPEECWAAMMLWCRAWKQTPPGSLPDDDRVLRAFSGAGPRWNKVRGMALRGFVKCSDGRLYHRVLCEEVNDAWERRKKFKERSAKANERRWAAVHHGGEPRALGGGETGASGDPSGNPSTIQQGLLEGIQQGGGKDSLEPPVEVNEKRSEETKNREQPQHTDPAAARRGEIAGFLTRQNVKVSSAYLVQWADDLAATNAQLQEAVDRCKNALQPGEPVPSKYFDTTLRRYLEQCAQPKPAPVRKRGVPEPDFSTLDYREGVTNDGRF